LIHSNTHLNSRDTVPLIGSQPGFAEKFKINFRLFWNKDACAGVEGRWCGGWCSTPLVAPVPHPGQHHQQPMDTCHGGAIGTVLSK